MTQNTKRRKSLPSRNK